MSHRIKENYFTHQYFGPQFGRLVNNLDTLIAKTNLPETLSTELGSNRDPRSLVVDPNQVKTYPILSRDALDKKLEHTSEPLKLARNFATVMMNIIIHIFNFIAKGKFDDDTNISIFKTTADTCNKLVSLVNRKIT